MTTKAQMKTFLDGAIAINSARVETASGKESKIQKAVAFYLHSDPTEGVESPEVFTNETTGLVNGTNITPNLIAEAVSRWIDSTYVAAISWETEKAAEATKAATPNTIDT